jgi:hypothetical protein
LVRGKHELSSRRCSKTALGGEWLERLLVYLADGWRFKRDREALRFCKRLVGVPEAASGLQESG